MQFHRHDFTDYRECGNPEFLRTMNTPSPERMRYFNSAKKTKPLIADAPSSRHTISYATPSPSGKGQATRRTEQAGGYDLCLRKFNSMCVKCRRIWPAHQLAKESCTDCKVKWLTGNRSRPVKKGSDLSSKRCRALWLRCVRPFRKKSK